MELIEILNRLVKENAGMGLLAALGLVVFMAAVGAGVGLVFPKHEATASLQFPELRIPAKSGNTVELSFFKRVSASYATSSQLKSYVDIHEPQRTPAEDRLLLQANSVSFWDKAVRPVLSFTKKDQKEYGDIGGPAAFQLLGLTLTADAPAEQMAVDMVNLLAEYFTNAVMRERIRSWVLAGKADALGSTAKGTEAKILRAQWDIQLFEQRAMDMKGLLTRYPDAARMDARQVVSVTPTEKGNQFLFPLAQLVGFESAISQRRERIRRLERDLKQKQMLAAFFTEAEPLIDATADVEKLVPVLQQLATTSFVTVDSEQEWVKEAILRVNGALDGFSVMLSQFGTRNGVSAGAVASRTPMRLALLLALLGAGGIAGIVFVRHSLRAADAEDALI